MAASYSGSPEPRPASAADKNGQGAEGQGQGQKKKRWRGKRGKGKKGSKQEGVESGHSDPQVQSQQIASTDQQEASKSPKAPKSPKPPKSPKALKSPMSKGQQNRPPKKTKQGENEMKDEKHSQQPVANGGGQREGEAGKPAEAKRRRGRPPKKVRAQNVADESRQGTSGGRGQGEAKPVFQRVFSKAEDKTVSRPGEGGQGQQKSKKPSRRQFQPHWEPHLWKHALAKGAVISGQLRINPKRYTECYVASPEPGRPDILIREVANRNRAMNGDQVVVDVLAESEWIVLDDGVEAYIKNRGLVLKGDIFVDQDDSLANGVAALQVADDDDDRDVVVEDDQGGEANGVAQPNEATIKPRDGRKSSRKEPVYSLKSVKSLPCWQRFVQQTGRVVAIIEEVCSRTTAGHLQVFADQNPNFALFKPLDSKFPRMKIARADCPADFFARPQDYEKNLFSATMIKWTEVPHALGKLNVLLGDEGDVDVRTNAILVEQSISDEDFGEAILSSLPAVPFAIPEEEIAIRRDFRRTCVFTIDPATARDLDDALSVEDLGCGKFRVGVHIADVSYFVREGSPLDKEASSRATSVYLIQKVVPMLPRRLCEDLCSLNPDRERLTFSVEWTLNEEGEIEDEWFGRSVIKSCCKLAYEHAQDMLDSPTKEEWTEDELPPVSAPWTWKYLSKKVNMLQKLALTLRKKREDNGALRLDQPKLSFRLDKESGMPNSYHLYEHRHR